MMDEYIEREAAKYAFYKSDIDTAQLKDIADVLCAIPTADVRPVVRGKWITRTDVAPYRLDGEITSWTYKCSICGTFSRLKYNYCPNCGADMREES